MIVVGLTGGMGSGKTTVSTLFHDLGVPVVDADLISHELTTRHAPAYRTIVEHFGSAILKPDKSIHRAKLAEIIFNDPDEKTWLENYLHPLIYADMARKIKQLAAPYCIAVIPLLLESPLHFPLDRILVIDCDEDLQQKRALHRDQRDHALIKKMLAAQGKRDDRLKMADDVLENNGDLKTLKQAVETLHASYLALSSHQKR